MKYSTIDQPSALHGLTSVIRSAEDTASPAYPYEHGEQEDELWADRAHLRQVLDDVKHLLCVSAKLCNHLSHVLGMPELVPDQGRLLVGLDQAFLHNASLTHAGTSSARVPADVKKDYGLTERELEVLKLVARGFRNPQIAQKLSLEKCTVEQHLSALYSKLGIPPRSRVELALFAREYNLA